ncbi:MAG TPA: O-methyltransferase [Opitutaceae bacterium]|jgi:predicted O-methyltransferase YrrM|nr:O-methyltransferase [Opitutaceae bacterium]
MSKDQWTAVDQYIGEVLLKDDPTFEFALKNSDAAGLPAIQVSPAQGKLLQLLVQSTGARRVLEVGTLGGYSTLWMARALPADGKLITLEFDPKHAEVARANIRQAALAPSIEVRVGDAKQTLPAIAAESAAAFDFIFIDADKSGYPEYFKWALKLSKPGTVIIADNVVRNGGIADAASTDASVIGVRRMNELVAAESRVSATAIQTVGSKGYDGFMIARVS